MDPKTVSLVVAGTDGKKEHPVELVPNVKARDVLTQLNLTGYQLTKPNGGAYAYNDDLYQSVVAGQKLFATKADVEAGT